MHAPEPPVEQYPGDCLCLPRIECRGCYGYCLHGFLSAADGTNYDDFCSVGQLEVAPLGAWHDAVVNGNGLTHAGETFFFEQLCKRFAILCHLNRVVVYFYGHNNDDFAEGLVAEDGLASSSSGGMNRVKFQGYDLSPHRGTPLEFRGKGNDFFLKKGF